MPVEPTPTTSLAAPLVESHVRLDPCCVEAPDLVKAAYAATLADDNHAAAIELAISVARLPKGTAIILQTKHHCLCTDILVCEPPQTDYTVLANVHRDEVIFASDPDAVAATAGTLQLTSIERPLDARGCRK